MKYILEGHHYKRGRVFYCADATLTDDQNTARRFVYRWNAVDVATRLNALAGHIGAWWEVLPVHTGAT